MGYIGKIPATQGKDAGPALKLDDISSGFDGLTTVFDLTVNGTAVDPHVNNISIYLSGVYQIPGNAYSLSGSQVVFTGAPSSSLDFHAAILGATRTMTPDNDSVEPASFTSNTRLAISGSFGNQRVGTTDNVKFNHITASGNISSSGIVIADTFQSTGGSVDGISFTDDLNITGNITASGNISSSASIIAKDFSGTFIGALSSSAQEATSISGSFSKEHLAAKVANVVTSSAQLSTDISGSFSKVHFDSKLTNVVTSSAQISTDISGSFSKVHFDSKLTNVVTSSVQLSTDISGSFSKEHLAAKVANVVTSSAQLSTDISGSFGNQRVGTADAVTFATVDTGQGANELYDMNQNVKTDSDVLFANATIAGTLSAQEIHTRFVSASVTLATGSNQFGDALTDVQNFTGSVNMSSSLSVFGHPTEKTLISGSSVSASSGTFTSVDIDGGTIDGITSLTAGGDLDIGAHDFRAATLTADGLTAGRVVFAGTNGVLSDDSDLTFATATLSATNLTTTGTIKNMALVSGSSVSTGSFGSVVAAGTGVNSFTGNVGIDTNNPLAPLHISKDVTQVSSSAESKTQAGLYLNFDPTAGSNSVTMFALSSSVATAGSYGLQVANSTGTGQYPFVINPYGGKVGIGTTAPDGPLHVFVSDVGITASADADDFIIENNVSNAGVGMTILSRNTRSGLIMFGDGDNNDRGRIQYNHAANYMRFDANGSEVMRISGSGNVGIGTASPDYLLDVEETTGGATGTLRIHHTSNTTDSHARLYLVNGGSSGGDTKVLMDVGGSKVWNFGVDGSDSDKFKFSANGDGLLETSTSLTIDTSGNIGIGMTPTNISNYDRLEIGGKSTGALLDMYTGSTQTSRVEVSSNAMTLEAVGASTNMMFKTNTAERMRITSAGYVGIGITAPVNPLYVQNTTSISGDTQRYPLYVHNNVDDDDAWGIRVRGGNEGQTGNTEYLSCYDHDNTKVGMVHNDGGTFSLVDVSDKRLKKNIRNTDINGIDTINSIKVRDFEYKINNSTVKAQFIAQEIQEVFPQASTGTDGALTEDGKIDPMGVTKEGLVGVLVKAVQELSEKIDSQQKEIEELKK